METLSRFLDFADSIIKKHSGFGYDYESAPMVYLEEEDPEPEGIREQKQYVTNLFQVTNLKEENYLYRQNLTFLTQILENRIYQPLYPGLEKQIEKAVREEMPEARERVIRDFSREIRTLMKEGGTRQLEILKERLLPAQEEENSEQKEQTILFRKLENIYNSSIYATTVQQYYADRYPENRVLQPGGQTWSVFRESAGQSLAKRRERTEIVPEEPVHFDYPEEESAGQTYFLEKALAEARRQTGSTEQKTSFLFQDAGNVLPRQRTDFLSLEYPEEARTQEYETEGRAAEKAGQETLSLSDAAARAGVQKEMPVQFANAEREFTSQPGKPAEFPAAQEQQSREGKPASLGPADEKERNVWDDAIRRSLDFAREVEEKAELKREHADRAKEVSVRADTDIPIVYLEETGDRSDAERTPEKQPQASQPRREETPSRRMPEDPASARQMLQDTVSAQTTAQDAKAVYRTSEGQEKSESALQDHIQKNREFTESVTGHTSVRADADIPIVYLEETRDRSDAEGTPEKQLQASQPRGEEISARRMPEDTASARSTSEDTKSVRRMPEDTVSARHTPQDTVSVQTTAQGAKAVHRTPEEQEKSESALQDHIQRNREFTESVTRHADLMLHLSAETGKKEGAVFRRFEMAPAVLEYTRDETAQIRREIIETVLPEIRQGTVPAEPSVLLKRTVHETAEQMLRRADVSAGHTGGNPAARSVALQQAEKVLADYAGNRAGAPETKEALETILRVYQVRVQSEEMMEHPGPLTAEKSGTGVRMKFPGEGVTLTMRPEPAAMVFARETDPKETQQETRRLKKEVEEIVTEIRTEKEKTVIHQEKLMERQKEIVREVITNHPSLLTEGKSGIQLARQMERALNLQLDKSVGRIADQVYRRLEERLKTERERRGFR